MLIFYTGAFGYIGKVEFLEDGCSCGEVIEVNIQLVSLLPYHYSREMHQEQLDEKPKMGLKLMRKGSPSALMQFAEYYLAIKLLQDDSDLNVVILDRTLAGDVGHLIWSVNELVREGRCVLQGLQTEFGVVSTFDLELARILHPNSRLGIPAPRSQFIKYRAIDYLLFSLDGGSDNLNYEMLLDKIGANHSRLGKLVNDVTSLNQEYSFLNNEIDTLAIKPGLRYYNNLRWCITDIEHRNGTKFEFTN